MGARGAHEALAQRPPGPFDPQPVAHTGENPDGRPALRTAALSLAGHAAALTAGFTATVTPAGATWLGVRGPHCPLGSCLGPLACPGCGLLRSTAAALQGDLAFAFAAHPAGPVTALLLLGGAVVSFDVLRSRHELPRHRAAVRVGRRLFAAAVLGGWLLRLAIL